MTQLDTNVLVIAANNSDPRQPVAASAIQQLHARGESLCVFPQNLYEFWTVATRPLSARGLGLDTSEAHLETKQIRLIHSFLPDSPGLFDEWDRLVVAYQCHGKVSYDARIVAAMNTHGVDRILTFNAADFQRFPWLTILDPATVAGNP